MRGLDAECASARFVFLFVRAAAIWIRSGKFKVSVNCFGDSLKFYKLLFIFSFIIFSLLIPYVHRDGSLGHQARDALLLCMALSQKNSNVGTYIAKYSSMCTVLVTGLGGLYSLLPNTIEITTADWHRITSDDVSEISELTAFMNALEFCNAVVQVAHELIREQLLDVMYLGFIVPVLGPALLQVIWLCLGKRARERESGESVVGCGEGGGFVLFTFI